MKTTRFTALMIESKKISDNYFNNKKIYCKNVSMGATNTQKLKKI